MKNAHGLDARYFNDLIARDLSPEVVNNQTPADLARTFARAARTACPEVLQEAEFQPERDLGSVIKGTPVKTASVRLEVIYDYRLTNIPDVVIVQISSDDIEHWEAIALIVADNGLEDASLYEDRCTFFKLAEGADRDDQEAPIEALDFCPHGESVVITANGVSWRGLAADEPLSSCWLTFQESFEELKKRITQ